MSKKTINAQGQIDNSYHLESGVDGTQYKIGWGCSDHRHYTD